MDNQTNGAYIAAGPLNIDCGANKVTTVMGAVLQLTPAEVKILYILATNEDKCFTAEALYDEVCKTNGKPYDRTEAMHTMNNILRQIEAHGDGFVWIERSINDDFTYKSRWGHNWGSQPNKSNVFRRKTVVRTAVGAVGLVAAAMVFMFTPLFSRSDTYEPRTDEFIYLHDPQVPMGTFEAEECDYCGEKDDDCACDK